MKETVPIAEKALLTLEEAAKYFNIGIKRLIKRKPFEEYLYKQYSI